MRHLLLNLAIAASVTVVGASAYADEGKNESGKDRRESSRVHKDGKDRGKFEGDRGNGDKDWEKRAEKREKDWRKQEERWHTEQSRQWQEEQRRRGGDRQANRGDYFRQHGYARMNVPNGHLPPPGECRIWYPDRPAGQQPPPGRCSRLASQVPPGAWLMERPSGTHRYYVSAYESSRPGVLLDRAAFDWRGGVLILIAQRRKARRIG